VRFVSKPRGFQDSLFAADQVILEALQAREIRDYRHMYAQEDEPQAWEDLIGCIESQGEEDAQCFDEAFGRRVAVRLRYSEARLLRCASCFTCKSL
jgi:regulator of sirC expression with transglutaminase-like and TPR domain